MKIPHEVARATTITMTLEELLRLAPGRERDFLLARAKKALSTQWERPEGRDWKHALLRSEAMEIEVARLEAQARRYYAEMLAESGGRPDARDRLRLVVTEEAAA